MNIPPHLMPIIGAVLGLALDYLSYAAYARDDHDMGLAAPSWKWELALQRAIIGAAAGYGISIVGGPQA